MAYYYLSRFEITLQQELRHCGPPEYIDYEPGWLWADPDIDQAARYMVHLLDDPDYRNRIADRAASDLAVRYNDEAVGAAITQRLAVLARAVERGASDAGERTERIPIDHRDRVHEPDAA